MANTTWNPSDLSGVTLSGGNLVATTPSAGGVRAADSHNSGKYYIEYTYNISTNSIQTGLSLSTANLTAPATGSGYVARASGNIVINSVNSGSSIGIIAQSAVIAVAVDLGANLIWFRVSPAGNWNGSGTANPATGVGGVSTSTIAGSLFPMMSGQTGDAITANFGDSAFSGAVPAGFTSGWPTGGTTGTLAYTEPADTIAIAANAGVAVLAYTEAPDTFAIAANASVTTLAYTEAPDTFAITEMLETTATLAYTEGPDTFSMAASASSGVNTLAYTEPPDTFAINVGIVPPYWKGPPALWPYRIDFTGPVIYVRAAVRVSGPACLGFRIGDIFFRRRALNYVDNIGDNPAAVTIPCFAALPEVTATLAYTEPPDSVAINGGLCTITLLTPASGPTWTVPANWNNANNKIEGIGGGAGGAFGWGDGGDGAQYTSISNITLTPGAVIPIVIGRGGASLTAPIPATPYLGLAGTDTNFNSGQLIAAGGQTGTVSVPSGTAGGAGGTNDLYGAGGGGGGAAGPNGVGGHGADGFYVGEFKNGSGGGGADGGVHGLSPTGTAGGAGGASSTGVPGGVGGTASTNPGAAGSGGSGGGGGYHVVGSGDFSGSGGAGSTAPSNSGGGGASGGGEGVLGGGYAAGGNGAPYGGGGGAGNPSGKGGDGVLIITNCQHP